MKHIFYLFSTIIILTSSSCVKRPFIADYTNAKGFVIGRESCKSNETEDYWLIDLTYLSDTPQYGDTLFLNGVTYTNVVKVKGLHENLKIIDLRVSIDFKNITTDKVQTTGCTIPNPVTYQLKELFIINQGEIR